MSIATTTLGGLAAILLATSSSTALAATTKSPSALKDDAYVTLHGTVKKILGEDEFTLGYKGGTIKVDTDDAWPILFHKDADMPLKVGDKITVVGQVDDNYFTKKEIDATSIRYQDKDYSRLYQRNRDANYYYRTHHTWTDPWATDHLSLAGTVSKVVNDDSFEMNYGTGIIKVDVGDMGITDTDRLKIGDHVTVYGEIDENWFGKREIEAESVVRTYVYPRRS